MFYPMTCYDLWLLMLELKPEGERREGKGRDQMMPSSLALSAACVRSRTPNFPRMLVR